MQGQVGEGPARQGDEPQVLHDEGVDPRPVGLAHHLQGLRQLALAQQGVQGQVDLDPPPVAVVHRAAQLLLVKVLGAAAGAELLGPQVDGVGPVEDGRPGLGGPPGGGEDLDGRHHWMSSRVLREAISRLSRSISRFCSSHSMRALAASSK